jgi:hypothetical protein
MAQVVDGRYTARMDAPFAVFIIGMWLPLHKDPAAVERGVTGEIYRDSSQRPFCLID